MLDESEPVSSYSFGKLDVSAHYGHPLGVDRAEIGIFEE